MVTIRQLGERDIPQVSELFLRVSPEAHWATLDACNDYLRYLLFQNPWRNLAIPSWLADDGGKIVGFYLLLPRSMVYRGEKLRVAVGCQISVDPGHRHSLIALQLAKAALTGTQDLTIADGAHERSRDMWLALGGRAPLVYNLHWIRLLRPARQMLTLLQKRSILPSLAVRALRPVAAAVDTAVARLRWNSFLHETDAEEGRSEALDAAAIAGCFEELGETDWLMPEYDQQSLQWLLREIECKHGYHGLRGHVVRSQDGAIDGWYLYCLQAGGTSEVIQLAARRGCLDRTLICLLADAWRNGAAMVRGRGDPRQVEQLSARHCWFRREGKCTLVYSRRTEIADAIDKGKAYLSRMEGEWPFRLVSG